MSTMAIVMSASVVKDIYQTMIKPDASPKTMKNITGIATAVITLIIFALSLNPTDILETVIVYAIGGMASAFYVPMVFGLYWMRANKWGALAVMAGGFLTFLLNSKGILIGQWACNR